MMEVETAGVEEDGNTLVDDLVVAVDGMARSSWRTKPSPS